MAVKAVHEVTQANVKVAKIGNIWTIRKENVKDVLMDAIIAYHKLNVISLGLVLLSLIIMLLDALLDVSLVIVPIQLLVWHAILDIILMGLNAFVVALNASHV